MKSQKKVGFSDPHYFSIAFKNEHGNDSKMSIPGRSK